MPPRTQILRQLPWIGGVNTSIDESVIPNNQLTVADNVIFATNGERKKREGINFNFDDATASTSALIAGIDTHLGQATKVQRQLCISEDREFYEYSSGTRTTISDVGTAWSGTLETASIDVIGNIVVIAASGTGNVLKKWTGTGNDVDDLGGTPPVGAFVRQHLGRIWTNDKTNLDRLHYSSTGNPEEWNGNGDSGAIDIGVGDGDPGGITAIFPTFKGVLFVAKKTKLYRISGFTPESFRIDKVSDNLGCVSHNAVAPVDQDDIIFVSERGVHSAVATDKFGDFESKYISADLQRTFNNNWTPSRRDKISAAYLSNTNSIAFSVSDSSLDGATENNCLWLYNTTNQAWYRWPNISAASIFVSNDADKQRWYLGGNNERIFQTQIGNQNDTTDSGSTAGIPYEISTGLIFPVGEPYAQVGFKRFILYYQKEGNHTITVNLTIDNYPTQTVTFSQTETADLLGSTFILGSSMWGQSPVMAAHSVSIDGYGKGIKIEISSTGETTSDIKIQGFGIEYETAGIEKEQDSG